MEINNIDISGRFRIHYSYDFKTLIISVLIYAGDKAYKINVPLEELPPFNELEFAGNPKVSS